MYGLQPGLRTYPYTSSPRAWLRTAAPLPTPRPPSPALCVSPPRHARVRQPPLTCSRAHGRVSIWCARNTVVFRYSSSSFRYTWRSWHYVDRQGNASSIRSSWTRPPLSTCLLRPRARLYGCCYGPSHISSRVLISCNYLACSKRNNRCPKLAVS